MGWTTIVTGASFRRVLYENVIDKDDIVALHWQDREHHSKSLQYSKHFGVYYIAEQHLEDVIGTVVLMARKNGEVSYKVMTERGGPSYYNMPQEVFDKLTPTTDNYAKGWRVQVRERLGVEQEYKQLTNNIFEL